MNLETLSFQARARTIDHLGREQIADCPTAISELWKNSYDAYAREVALHLFDGETPTAALLDDGHGMSRLEFVEKWLVIGTESKFVGGNTPPEDRNGLPLRQRQGQKGIGRLSAAALGPLLLVISKRRSHPFVASLLDWRIFENPFLFLSDIELPVVEFFNQDQLFELLPKMFDRLMSNIWGDGDDPERSLRIAEAWRRLDEIDAREDRPSLRVAIETVLISTTFAPRHLERWPAWAGDHSSGTAMLIADLAFDLEANLPSRVLASEQQTAQFAKNRLFETLSGFTDPFVSENELGAAYAAPEFHYSVIAWEGALSRVIVSCEREFRYQSLEELEHVVEGDVDSDGAFKGRIKAFGKWLDGGIVIAPLATLPKRIDSKVGPFHIRLATFELIQSNSSHPQEIHSKLIESARRYAGFMVYRNGLRVMPYGREDNDFFEIEKRRSQHAGREFWSFRRIFGRVALTREFNPNLKDKAGREGLIDNKAAKVFRDLVENILVSTARRFFGTDSPVRKQLLPDIKADNGLERATEAAGKLRARKRREFRLKLKSNIGPMRHLRDELEALAEVARSNKLPETEDDLIGLRTLLSNHKETRSELSIGGSPRPLGTLEADYSDFRNASRRVNELIVQLDDSLSAALEKITPRLPKERAFAQLSRNAGFIQARIRKWGTQARELLTEELQRLNSLVEERNKQYHAEMLPLVDDLAAGRAQLAKVLGTLDDTRDHHFRENEELFESYLSILRSLRDNIDLETLVSVTVAESERAQDEIERLTSLAQLGITVEIIGHEIEGLEITISQGLLDLESLVSHKPAYVNVTKAHRELSDRLRFLSPLKLSGDQTSAWVSGNEIFDYVKRFLHRFVDAAGVTLSASSEFLEFSVYDRPSRILPVFVNLVNNSLYWVGQTQSHEKSVLLAVRDRKVIVADSGPGVDAEDVEHLFRLFFTKKIRGGRGVGLYLCRTNLAAGGHTISYDTNKGSKLLPGANFVIDFQRAKYA